MRRIAALFLAVLLTLAMCFASSATQPGKQQKKLSELSEEECTAFIKSSGLEIPEELTDYQSLGAFIKNIIATIEEDPYYQFAINYPVTYEFANQIKTVVNNYYGVSEDAVRDTHIGTKTYPLLYSTLYGNWLDEYYGYNCYSYALGQTRPFDGMVLRHWPGCFNTSTYPDFSLNMTVGQMADLTMSDLESLRCACRLNTTSYSEIMNYSDTHFIICLRKCSSTGLEDYHYMKLAGSAWLHKPGLTHVLQLNTIPSESVWSNEAVRNGEYMGWDRYYTGDIYYFAFRTEHNMGIGDYTGNHYHEDSMHSFEYRSTCTDCGECVYYWESMLCMGPPCTVPDTGLLEAEGEELAQ